MITTPWLEVGEEGRGRSIQKLDALTVKSNSNRQIDADFDIHWVMRIVSGSFEFKSFDLRRGLIDHAHGPVPLADM